MKNLANWKFLLLGLFGCMLAFSSCSDDDDENSGAPDVETPGDKTDDENNPQEPNEVAIEDGKVSIDGMNGSFYVNLDPVDVDPTAVFAAKADDEWVHSLTVKRGEDDKLRVDFTADANPLSTKARETEVTVTADDEEVTRFSVRQAPAKAVSDSAATFVINVTEVTHNSAAINVKPSSEDVQYYVNVMPQSEVDLTDEAAFTDDIISSQDFSLHIKRGEASLKFDELIDQTMYVAVVFEYTAKSGAGKVTTASFRTTTPPVTGEKFTLTIDSIGYTDMTLHVKPSTGQLPWFYVVLEKEYYDKYVEMNEVVARCYYVINNRSNDLKLEISDYLKTVALVGEDNIRLSELKQDKDYAVVVFYVNTENDDPETIFDTDYSVMEFRTKKGETAPPALQITSSSLTVEDGQWVARVNVKGVDVAFGKYSLTDPSYQFTGWDLTDPTNVYTMATMFGKALSATERTKMMSDAGATFTWYLGNTDVSDTYVFAIYVENSQGVGTQMAVEVKK